MPIVKSLKARPFESVESWKTSIRESLQESFALLSEEALKNFVDLQEATIAQEELKESIPDAKYQQLRKNAMIAPDPAKKADLHTQAGELAGKLGFAKRAKQHKAIAAAVTAPRDAIDAASAAKSHHVAAGLKKPADAEHHFTQAAAADTAIRTNQSKVAKQVRRSQSPRQTAARAALTAPRDNLRRSKRLGLKPA